MADKYTSADGEAFISPMADFLLLTVLTLTVASSVGVLVLAPT